jgi:hypothetical protein
MVHCYRRLIGPSSSTTYPNAELGEKQLGFGGVLVFGDRVSIGLLDKSIGNQAIENHAFIRIQAFGPFQAPPGDNVTKDRQFFVGNRVGVCHLTAPYELPTVSFAFTLGPSPACEVLRITLQSLSALRRVPCLSRWCISTTRPPIAVAKG